MNIYWTKVLLKLLLNYSLTKGSNTMIRTYSTFESRFTEKSLKPCKISGNKLNKKEEESSKIVGIALICLLTLVVIGAFS